MLTEVWSEA